MNARQTALDDYLTHTAAIHTKLQRLRQIADDYIDLGFSGGNRDRRRGGWDDTDHPDGRGGQSAGVKLTTFIPARIKRHGGRQLVIPAAAGDKTIRRS